jgi:uncharacterized protein (TIGR03437 family)
MASSSDGAILHFATSNALKGEPLTLPSVRVFRHAETPLRQLVAPRDSRVITAPYLSSDALTTGVFTYSPCAGSCTIALPRDGLQLERNGKEYSFTAAGFRVSRNGRFVFETSFAFGMIPPTLRDLDTGNSGTPAGLLGSISAQSITNQGAVLSLSGTQARLTPLGLPPLVIFDDATARMAGASISADGNTVAILTEIPPGKLQSRSYFKLLLIDVASLKSATIFEDFSTIRGLMISDDGRRLVLNRGEELVLWDRSTGWRSLFSHQEAFADLLLSGDGNTVFATTSTNRIYRIDTSSGDSTQLYAPFPTYLRGQTGSTYPGSLSRFTSDYIGPELQLQVDSQSFPRVMSEANLLEFQIPWEATGLRGDSRILEIQSPDSPFVLRHRLFIEERSTPRLFLDTRQQFLTATNQDFTAFITEQNPARPGDLIHFWATGLGPLDRPVPTGAKGPSDPPAKPMEPATCQILGRGGVPPNRALEITTQIYAPNFVGIYQFDVRIPEEWPSGSANIACKGPSDFGSTGTIFIGAR